MAETTLTIGAPSLAGEDACIKAKEIFEEVEYPCPFTVQNFLAQRVEVLECGIVLEHVAADGGEKLVNFDDFESLALFVSIVSSLATSCNSRKAVVLSQVVPEKVGAAKVGESRVRSTGAKSKTARTTAKNAQTQIKEAD